MKPWPPELGARTVTFHTAHAGLLRAQARNVVIEALFGAVMRAIRYAVEAARSRRL